MVKGPHATRLEALLALSNVAAGTAMQVQALVDSGFIPVLLAFIKNENEAIKVRREACWALGNMTSNRIKGQIDKICENDCISHLIEFISTAPFHAGTNWKIVQSLTNIFESADSPNQKYMYPTPQPTQNPYVDYVSKNTSIMQALFSILDRYENFVFENYEDETFDGLDPRSCREKTLDLLKQTCSQRFRDWYVPYCHHRNKVDEVNFL